MEESKKCSCKWVKCPRHGDCAACRAHHLHKAERPFPFCESKKKNPVRQKAQPDLDKSKRLQKKPDQKGTQQSHDAKRPHHQDGLADADPSNRLRGGKGENDQ